MAAKMICEFLGSKTRSVRADVFIFIENLLPGLAAIERAEDAALGVGTIRMSHSADEEAVRVLRVDDDGGDLLRVAEAEY